MCNRFWPLSHLVLGLAAASLPANAQIWGRLANPGFENQRMKATLFFAGQARDDTKKYFPHCGLPNDEPFRTLYPPTDSFHLKWSESEFNRHLALNLMVDAGINVVNMSSWGEQLPAPDEETPPPCLWENAPMQTSPQSHDELFAAAMGKPLLITPYLESRGGERPWTFRSEFPRTFFGEMAPGTISQIMNLIGRYLKNPQHPEWAEKWARVYDRHGEARYAVAIIHAASDQLGVFPPEPLGDDFAFAAGFDELANEIFRLTGGVANGGVKVGFFIDALPDGSFAPGRFKPTPEFTGAFLRSTSSLLGIECFAPEVWFGSSETALVINWKRNFSVSWFQTGIPFIMDVSSGYDAHIVFPNAVRYGLTPEWLNQLGQMNLEFGRSGMVFNSWNGFSEAMVALPGVEHREFGGGTRSFGSLFYDWLRSLQAADVYARKPDAPAPRQGTFTSPYTLPEAVQNVPVRGTIGLLPTTFPPFDTPITISKPCTITAIGGSARIGQ